VNDGDARSSRSRADLERWFDTLIAAHGPALSRLAGSYVRGSDEREDLLQEIVVAIWGALPRFRGDASERTFLFRIAHNRAIAFLARRRLPTVEASDQLEVPDGAPDPERTLSAEQEGQRLSTAVQNLPIAYAQVVTLTLEGMSYAEIADVLGVTETNVGARLTRARAMLRKLLRNADAR
jgi:RNA polymerase sigma-70 factor (ECF subfamily)